MASARGICAQRGADGGQAAALDVRRQPRARVEQRRKLHVAHGGAELLREMLAVGGVEAARVELRDRRLFVVTLEVVERAAHLEREARDEIALELAGRGERGHARLDVAREIEDALTHEQQRAAPVAE